MTRYIGCDAHKKEIAVCVVDAGGQVLERRRVACTREAITAWAEQALTREDHVVLEATFHTWAIVDLLVPFVQRVVVSNPLRTQAIAAAKIKTDSVDAETLAQLLRSDYLPEVWIPDPETRRRRQLTHRRAALVADRTALKNRIHAVLAARLVPAPWADLFGTQGLRWLREVALDATGRAALDSDLRLLEGVERELGLLDAEIAPAAYTSPPVRLLMTLPGVDATTALALLAAWGDVTRFPDADHAASALGLAPSTRQSAEHCYHGPITKRGNSHARWLLVQAAQHLDQHPGPLGHFFRKLAKKKSRNVAVVATARKLATVAWWMLRRNEPYRYAVPATVQVKLAHLRVRATGRRRPGGTAKGTPRSDRYGTGLGLRRTPDLNTVLTREELPCALPPAELPSAELRVLAESETLTHALAVHHPSARPRPRAGRLTGS